MYRNLVIFSNSFPYDTGETFLESEVKYNTGFQNICLFPLNVNCPDSPREIPPEIHVGQPVICNWSTSQLFLRSLPALFQKDVRREIVLLIRQKKLSIMTLKNLFSFYLKGKYGYKKVLSQLKAFGVKPDDETVFYSYWMYHHAYTMVLLANKFPNSKLITRCHGYDLYAERHPNAYLPMRQLLFSWIDAICPISQDGCDYLKRLCPGVETKCKVFRLGTKDYGTVPYQKTDCLRVVSCSGFVPVKRIHLLIKALSAITDFPVCWTHIGGGLLQDKLQEMAEDLLKGQIRYEFVGNIPNTELMELYKSKPFDVFVNVSESEGIPVSVMEAASFGTPTIATDVGGTKEIIEDGENGYLIPKDFDSSLLADRLKQLWQMNADDYIAMRTNARSVWQRKYNADSNYRQFADFLKM